MANVSGTKMPEPAEDPPRVLSTLGPELTSRQATELDIQASADVVDDDLKKPAPKKEKLFPVKLLKAYRPLGDFEIGQPNPETGKPYREPTEEERMRIPAGTDVLLPVDEAKRAISLKIGERNDPLPTK